MRWWLSLFAIFMVACSSEPVKPKPVKKKPVAHASQVTYDQHHVLAADAVERTRGICSGPLNRFLTLTEEAGSNYAVTLKTAKGSNRVNSYVFESVGQTLVVNLGLRRGPAEIDDSSSCSFSNLGSRPNLED